MLYQAEPLPDRFLAASGFYVRCKLEREVLDSFKDQIVSLATSPERFPSNRTHSRLQIDFTADAGFSQAVLLAIGGFTLDTKQSCLKEGYDLECPARN